MFDRKQCWTVYWPNKKTNCIYREFDSVEEMEKEVLNKNSQYCAMSWFPPSREFSSFYRRT